MESDLIISTDADLQKALTKFSKDLFEAVEGFKPRFTLVFCPEKQLLKSQNEVEEVKEDKQQAILEIIAKETLIEEEAMRQLNAAARLKGCTHAYGMPDLHPGKGIPIGASIITHKLVYPELVDYDIGCGMSFIRTGMPANKMTSKRLDQLSSSLKSIDCPWGTTMEQYSEFLS